MSRKTWLVLAVAALVAASLAASGIAAKRASEDRPRFVTRGLDYLHARQLDNGGFSTAENTAWAVLGAVASGERMGSSAWTRKGNNPFDYLQSVNHETSATSATVDNAPVYYARMIMAYVAVDRRERVFVAGTPHVDLLAKLYTYQDMADGSPTRGSFSPSSSTRNFDAVHTTSWAALSMYNFGLSTEERFLLAETWLAGMQSQSDGGFPTEAGKSSDCLTTALAIQALSVGPGSLSWDAAAARQFLKDNQNADGGFPASPGGRTNAEATSAAIQAILALGENPDDPFWAAGINTPTYALGVLQQTNGAYRLTSRERVRPLAVTSWALTAMRRKSFASFPRNNGVAETAFKFRPVFRTVSPGNGAKFKSHVVLIRATYTDFYPKGTGIRPSACRLYVNNENKSRPADIGKYGLRLLLKNVPNGTHTYKIELRDQAGNAKVIERTFTVAVPSPSPTYTPVPRPTYNPGPITPVFPTTTPRPYVTPTPSPTPTPSVTPSPDSSPSPAASPVVTGSPLPSPSASASPAGTGDDGGGSAAGFVGGTLLAMLPIGAVISYLLLQRREESLGAASQGTVLDGGGSAWERFKHTLARSKDLTRPSSRE
ncbi:MAG: prenyltransferase/squalene oxidase repeat-containing protein [Deltaproteobacteria bacterium]